MTTTSLPAAQHAQHAQHQRSLQRLQSVLNRTGVSRSGLYQLIAQGAFPKPIPLNGRAVAWDSLAIDAWIEARITAAA
jgi:prophage regulatory protein